MPSKSNSGRTKTGFRAITMQQPFAAAMVHGQGLYTRRGKPTQFVCSIKDVNPDADADVGPDDAVDEPGEWVVVHCGSNQEHLKDKELMNQVRLYWPECPDQAELLAGQGHLLGMARFIDGNVSARKAEKECFYLQRYDCTKPCAWKADRAFAFDHPISYPKGQLQVWNLYKDGFTDEKEICYLRNTFETRHIVGKDAQAMFKAKKVVKKDSNEDKPKKRKAQGESRQKIKGGKKGKK